MPYKSIPTDKFGKLRFQAEKLIEQQSELTTDTSTNILELIHELAIYQTELEIQNEELKRAQQELSELEEQYEELFAFAPCGYILLDGKGLITRVNLMGARLLGVARRHLMLSTFSQFIAGDRDDAFYAVQQEALRTGQKQSVELPLKNEDDAHVWTRVDIEAVQDDSGEVLQWRIVLVDIRAHRKAEKDRERIQAQLHQAQKLESIGILAGGIAHDFNNLLSMIIGYVELAKIDSKAGRDVADLLSKAMQAIMLGRNITEQLLTFSRGGQPLKKQESIGFVIEDTLNQFDAGPNINVNYPLPKELWKVECDKKQIRLAFENILINAVEAMPGGGCITVTADNIVHDAKPAEDRWQLSKGHYVKISIQDQGQGISEENLSKIFDPYFSTKVQGAQKGMGLGLTAAYSIFAKHDGYISVESELGSGATVNLFLGKFIEKEPDSGRLGADAAELPELATGKILFMDDEKAIRDIGVQILSRLGMDVVTARDGDEAFNVYHDALNSSEPFEAVILDLSVKDGVGGREAAQEILAVNPDAKLVVTSGYSNDPVMTRYQEHGFIGAIEKPFMIKDLISLLKKIGSQ